MRIVMDFRKFDRVVGGVEQVVMQIAHFVSSRGHTIILVSKKNRSDEVKKLFQDYQNIEHVSIDVPTHAISLRNAYHDSVTFQDIAKSRQGQVIHFTYNWSFPFRKKVPTLLTIHDVIPFTFREAMGFFRNRFLYKPAIKKACRLNTAVSTISEFSKHDIAGKTGIDPQNIYVIPNGFRKPHPPTETVEKELTTRYDLSGGFVLNVGGIHERKNIVRMVQAFAEFVKQANYPGKLLITGSVSGAPYQIKMKKLCDAAVEKTGMQQRVVFTGFVSDEELDVLLNRAHFLIYPSLYEGFGIPILEAMNARLPVITSNVTAMKEVAEGAAVLVDPCDVRKMTGAMVNLYSDKELQTELIEKGLSRARLYSWEKLSEKYLELYQKLIDAGSAKT